MTDDILISDDGWSVPVSVYPRRSDAAMGLLEDQIGTPASWIGILRIARQLTGPDLYRHHRKGDIGDGLCGCEDDTWVCVNARGKPAGSYWYFDGGHDLLEDAAWFGAGPEDER